MPDEEIITEEQATAALHELHRIDEPEVQLVKPTVKIAIDPAVEPVAEPPAEEEPVAVEAGPEEVPTDEEAAPVEETVEVHPDVQAAEDRGKARLDAYKQRTAASAEILNQRHLRKSSVADRLLKTLQEIRTEAGVDAADIDRVIRETQSTMNPASPSYVEPVQEAAPSAAREDQALILNSFLNETDLTTDEAIEFGNWVKTEAESVMSPGELAVANESLGGFFRLAYGRFQQTVSTQQKETKRSDAVNAVRSVKRTQAAAARAASSRPAAPRKQTPGPTTRVEKELTKDDVALLLRQSVEQHY